MSHHDFQNGDRVAVFNMTNGGRHVFEGWATIRAKLPTDHHYSVEFETEPGRYERFVTLDGQDNPAEHVAEANRRRELAE